MKITSCLILIILALTACKDNGNPDPELYAVCDQLLYEPCTNSAGEYCLFGYKWGEDNPMTNFGVHASGPKTPGGIITYSFQPAGKTVHTHSSTNLKTSSFSVFNPCVTDQIKRALNEWQQIANLQFQEEPEGSDSQIRFIVADIRQSGIGYPNYPNQPCLDLAGDVFFSSGKKDLPCEDGLYPLALHEIGHALGLGHVQSQNIMSTRFWDDDILEIQSGDSAGIVEIYGPRP